MIMTDSNEFDVPGIEGKSTGVKLIGLGGHFPGSMVALFEEGLFIADTIVTVPSGMGDWKERGRPKGMTSFVFMYSIPNVSALYFLLLLSWSWSYWSYRVLRDFTELNR